jgi:GT2 family glycosyltransferase
MISIVTAYYNRKEELWRTLKTIEKSEVKDFEFIIVDDGSDWRQRIEDFASEFSFIRLKRIEIKDKTYINPCIPFNVAFSIAQGDLILIQNPECLHMGDVLKHVRDNSKYDQYLVYSCYSLSEKANANLKSVNFDLSMLEIEKAATAAIGGFTTRNCDTSTRYDSWFAHPVHRRAYFNFMTSLTRKDLYELNGFDERFADGHAFDDTEFVSRVEKKGMKIEMVEHPFCLHQWHPPHTYHVPDFVGAERRNRMLYETLRRQPHIKAQNRFMEGNL